MHLRTLGLLALLLTLFSVFCSFAAAEAIMKVDVLQKDMKIINAFAAELQCPTPLLSAAAQIYTSALAGGRAKQDTASVCAVLEEMAGIKRG